MLIVISQREDDIIRVFSYVHHGSIPLLSGKSIGIESCDDLHLFLKVQFSYITEGYPDSLPCTWPGPMLVDELTR
jgi:hypothetical protein